MKGDAARRALRTPCPECDGSGYIVDDSGFAATPQDVTEGLEIVRCCLCRNATKGTVPAFDPYESYRVRAPRRD